MRAIATGKALGYNPEQIYMNSVAAISAALNVAVACGGAPYVNGISLSRTEGSDRTRSGTTTRR